jgi:hypothetical protein
MQMDAAMGAVSAILEMIVSFRLGTVRVTDRLPKGWRSLSVSRVRVPGGFTISAEFAQGRVQRIKVASERAGSLKLEHSLGEAWTLDGLEQLGAVATLPMDAGESRLLLRSSGGQLTEPG